MRTFSMRAQDVEHGWFLVDAKDQILGRLATEIARRLRGKHKPEYTPHVDTGDHIIVLNASQIRVTGHKATDKVYYHHSSYPGGLKSETYKDLLARCPERIIELAVKGMLPKNSLGRAMLRKLKIYPGSEHPHSAQQPHVLSAEEI